MDRDRADSLVQEIGAEIVRGSKFAARPWETIVVVADFHGQRRLFGYCFWDGGWEAATPDGFRALLLFGELRDAMTRPGTEPWRKALLRIRRADGVVTVEFDDAGDRWVPTPSDPDGFADALRLSAPGAAPRASDPSGSDSRPPP